MQPMRGSNKIRVSIPSFVFSVSWKKVERGETKGNLISYGETTNNGMTLTLPGVVRKYSGQYRCEANNGVGDKAEEQINLKVLCELIIFITVGANKASTPYFDGVLTLSMYRGLTQTMYGVPPCQCTATNQGSQGALYPQLPRVVRVHCTLTTRVSCGYKAS